RGIFEAPWATPILGPAWPPKPAPPQVALSFDPAIEFRQKKLRRSFLKKERNEKIEYEYEYRYAEYEYAW
ncbi:MAG: hypothetical protein AAFN77_20955, partial [Planctomycetota bacterium]